MNDFEEWLKDITIYHKIDSKYEIYHKKAFVKNTTTQNRDNTGLNSSEIGIIRVFDIKGYKHSWTIQKNDIIVNKSVEDKILQAPITELSKKYGRDNVYQVKSVTDLIYNDPEIDSHIKIEVI